ncbi:DedA family protein [Couchioplanes caeruleus]|uniref:Membrane protein DedA with SNARE-associated domain n=1 Tax=Couchioplanes caeruleus TaxID=56438 RepID=A0A3N1GNV5_9ACTN|nr:DedA family protein [Couchioplanes caeruleus]ROP31927.1 membrane protein DedA with SNARE-associated domain [Couchioplanes caeruleus]
MTDLLTILATPAWAYLALFGFLVVDALVPVVPIQAIMITSGALTVYGNLNLALVIAVGALGMFTGDSIAFVLGRTAGHAADHRGGGRLAALRARFAPGTDGAEDAGDPHRGGAAGSYDATSTVDEARGSHDRVTHSGKSGSRTRRAAQRFTRGLRKPGPLVLLLCRFVPGGRMAAGYHAGRTGYPIKLFVLYDGGAALAWATYGGLVGHVGGTAVTQSAWRLFAIAATAAVIFGTAGWILALFGGRKSEDDLPEDAAGEDEPVPNAPIQPVHPA